MAQSKGKSRILPVVLLGVAVVTLGVGAVALMRNFLHSTPPPPKQQIQEVHLIRPPPPPPDLPPPPPPPPEEKVDVSDPQDKPDPTPSNEPPPGEQLGLDAEGSAGGDDFGLAARKGGRDLLASGGSAYAWYSGLLKDEVLNQLGAEKRAHQGEYSVVVRVWVRNDGTIERVRVTQSSGNRERDQAIEAALARITRLSQPPPADMPEPISLRIVSRG
ncbi:MAG TPA: TonB family protein [Steroidobacteraceae bacterium]|nr:TonB family protein [Steroidobacteraceae bacterium]